MRMEVCVVVVLMFGVPALCLLVGEFLRRGSLKGNREEKERA